MTSAPPIDLEALRAQLEQQRGPQYWRSLDELADEPAFRAFARTQHPAADDALADPLRRRELLKVMAASFALGGLSACTRQPVEKILPYAKNPEHQPPGEPRFFATTMVGPNGPIGLLAESHQGRPIKVEGNPEHPASGGTTDAFCQASVLELYDPDRSQVVERAGQISTWNDFFGVLGAHLEQHQDQGLGLRVLSRTIQSPTLARMRAEFLLAYPEARWVQYEPCGRDAVRAGAELAFGRDAEAQLQLASTDVIVALDADFLTRGPGALVHAREFAKRRAVDGDAPTPARLYALESSWTVTGSKADHRLGLRPTEVVRAAQLLAARVGVEVQDAKPATPAESALVSFVDAVAQDLKDHAGRSVVVAGPDAPAYVHALAHAVNAQLGNAGKTVTYTAPAAEVPEDGFESLAALTDEIRANGVHTLLILDGNPVYDAPRELEFGRALEQVGLLAHLSLLHDETSSRCHWQLPEAHYLEAWGDARAFDGTASLTQPLIAPLYAGRSAIEVVARLLGAQANDGYELVRETWRDWLRSGDFETFWAQSLHVGVLAGTPFRPLALQAKTTVAAGAILARLDGAAAGPNDSGDPQPGDAVASLELRLRPDPTVWDGRYANNGWLQELPKPISLVTWDNGLYVGPELAEQLELASGDVVEITCPSTSATVVTATAWILPGQPSGTVELALGYGRRYAGRVGSGRGTDAYPLLSRSGSMALTGVSLRRTGAQETLACVQDHSSMEGRDLVRSAPLAAFLATGAAAAAHAAGDHAGDGHAADGHGEGHGEHGHPSLLESRLSEDEYGWGMTIDLNACTGCNVCVIACQAENNIPVVGKDEVIRGREMHWIRVDRYFGGDPVSPSVFHQPVPCMHCENAPCEVVCPVAATTHSPEGLNEMTYNRCVGTRYCANNCPYKVRRFNFFQYADYETESLKLLNNPEVTVRFRGVMEKCTYCVQKISRARIQSKREDRRIADGEIITACQSVCPSQAIVFGDVHDPTTRVSQLKAQPRNYGLLEELNTVPRTTYLSAVTHPNPLLTAPASEDEEA